jgi:TonB family protein
VVKKGGTPTRKDLVKIPSDMVVVANPTECGGDSVEVDGIGLVAGQRQIQARGSLLTGNALRDLLPGIELRKGAVGAVFAAPAPPSNSTIAVKYRGTACGPEPMLFRMTFAPPRRVQRVDATMPTGLDAAGYIGTAMVKVRFTVGPDGRPTDVSIVSGEARFAEAAMEAVRQWRYDLPTVNGWPVFAPVTITADVPVVKR